MGAQQSEAMNENEQQYRVRWLSSHGVPGDSEAGPFDMARITLREMQAALPNWDVWIEPPPPREEWSPMLAAGDMQYSLYADGTFEIRDSGAIYAHLTAAETTAMLAWLDARPREGEV